jgi:5-methylcytosine-specific restriction endonuclease McrA
LPIRRTFGEVEKEFVNRGYILLDTVYKNNKQKLKYLCKVHSNVVQEIRFNDLTTGHGCRLCGEERKILNLKKMAREQRTPEEEVIREFKKRGYMLLSRYKNAQEPLKYLCPQHPEKPQRIRISDLKSGAGCKYCVIDEAKLGIEVARQVFEDNGYEMAELTYQNTNTPMRYICPKHPDKDTRITISDLKGGHGCKYCAIENSRGKLSAHYNHDLPDEIRSKDRRYDAEIHAWRKAVYERDNYSCVKCGDDRGGNLNAHHKDGFAWCIERRYDVSNGATLCENCHRKFHSRYSNKDNTESQFEEWVKEASE